MPTLSDKGLEPSRDSLGKSKDRRPGGAKSGALLNARRSERRLKRGLRAARAELRTSDQDGLRRLRRLVRRAKNSS